MDKLILQAYQTAVALSPAPSELKAALKTNERVPLFLARIKKELESLPQGFVTEPMIINVVTDMTNLFISQLKKSCDERMATDLDKRKAALEQEKASIIRNAVETGRITDEVMDAIKD